MNPYESPAAIPPVVTRAEAPADFEYVFRLLRSGGGLWLMPSYVGTGFQLYGQKDPQQLLGPYAVEAEQIGCHAYVYQSVLWLTIAFFPLAPLGVFRVLPALDSTWGQQVKLARVAWDWRQVCKHFAVAWIPFFLFVALCCGGLIRSTNSRRKAENGMKAKLTSTSCYSPPLWQRA